VKANFERLSFVHAVELQDDNNTVNFPLFDVYDNEMATFVEAYIGNSTEPITLIVDISSYMTIIYETDTIEPKTQITYRGGPTGAILGSDYVNIRGYKGAHDQEEPQFQDFKVLIDIARVNINSTEPLKHQGVLGMASIANSKSKPYSFLQTLVRKGLIATESYRFNEVFLNTTAEQYQSSFTLGFSELPSKKDYLLTNNTLPRIQDSEFNVKKVYQPLLVNVGLKEVDILNYFDVADFEKNETVIIDTAVIYLQLPENTLEYFDDTFFSDN